MGRKKKKKELVVHPWSFGECPSGAGLVSAWEKKGESQKDFIWLLSVLGELACFVDYGLDHRGGFGNIRGRKGGLRDFLEREAPSLLPRYKSVSRYMALAKQFKVAFDYYPPAALSLLHPELPLHRYSTPFVVNYARKIYREYLLEVPPEYNAFAAVLKKRQAEGPPRHRWGMPLPREQWKEAEWRWRRCIVFWSMRH